MARQVKFSVRIHQGGYSYEGLRRIWREADSLGYYSATLYDLLNIPTLECWTALSALAAETQQIRLTPMVLSNPYRPPALLAKMAATLDVISRGRFELGIGAGGGGGDHRSYGYPFPSTAVRVGMLEEAADLIKRLWTETRVDFEGSYYTLRGAAIEPRPEQQPRPPVLIGGHGSKYLLRAAARHADICNIGSEMSVAEHRAKLAVLAEHCEAVGRDVSEIEVSHNSRVFIAENDSEFENLLARNAANSQVGVKEYRESISNAIAGTPEQCIQQLRSYVENGISYFFLVFPDPVPSRDLELFAREVMPEFEGPY